MNADERTRVFARERRYLVGVAYRMLGSVVEAEDIAQEAYLRWQRAEDTDVVAPRAYLARVVARLCLDRLKSAQARQEEYVGTWLPEPIVEELGTERLADDVSIALLMTLERLSPLERAAFLLHDVFDMDYSEVANLLDRNEAAVRQLAARGREHIRDAKPRYRASEESELKLAEAFATAAQSGDVETLAAILAEDAVMYTDGGGKRTAALNPIYGAEHIIRFVEGVRRKFPAQSGRVARINGLPGLVIRAFDGGVQTVAFECVDDKIVAIYSVRNPDKLRHVD